MINQEFTVKLKNSLSSFLENLIFCCVTFEAKERYSNLDGMK